MSLRHTPAWAVVLLWICLLPLFSAQAVDTVERDDVALYRLSNASWCLEVAPELGGKIVSLYDRRSGREWLWAQDPARGLVPPTEGAGFGQENLMGMDELLPSLQEEAWDHYTLPGHGEVWSSRTAVDEAALADGVIETRLVLKSLPLIYTRRVSLEGTEVRMDYVLENTSDESIPFLWALHPFFTIAEGDRFVADFEPPALRVFAAPGVKDVSKGDVIAWPGRDVGMDLSALSVGEVPKGGIKFFATSPEDGAVALWNPDSGARLEIDYDAEKLPWLAVWLSRGIWSGAHHVVIEPTNRPGESIQSLNPEDSQEVERGRLSPGETGRWSVTFRNASRDRTSTK